MDIGEIVNDAIRYPSSDWKKVIILGLLFLISFLIVPIFLVIGYVFRALKASIAGSDELPEFDEWGDMFIDGLKVFIVQFVYFLIPALIIFVGMFTAMSSMAMMINAGTDPTAAFGLMGITGIIGMILAIVIGLISTIAIANMAYNDSELGAAFRFSEIMDIIKKIGWVDYIIWYVVIGIVMMIIAFIGSLLNIIPFIGMIIAILVIYPYMYLFGSRALALLYAFE